MEQNKETVPVRDWLIAIKKSGLIEIIDKDCGEYAGENAIPPDKTKEFEHIKTPEESPQDILDISNKLLDRKRKTAGINKLEDEFLEPLHNRLKQAFIEDFSRMSDEEAVVFIKNYNAYELFYCMPDIIEGCSRDDARKFSRYIQGLNVLDSFITTFDVLKELGESAGYGGEFFEMPLKSIFEEFLAADIYSSFDVQDWDYRFLIINGVEQLSGEHRKVFTKELANELTGEHISIPAGYTDIGSRIFSLIKSPGDTLKSVTIPEGVERIHSHAFSGCWELERVTIPDSVTYIGKGAFPGPIVSVNASGEVVDYEKLGKNKPHYGCDDLTITCSEGSCPHRYAVENGLSLIVVNGVVW